MYEWAVSANLYRSRHPYITYTPCRHALRNLYYTKHVNHLTPAPLPTQSPAIRSCAVGWWIKATVNSQNTTKTVYSVVFQLFLIWSDIRSKLRESHFRQLLCQYSQIFLTSFKKVCWVFGSEDLRTCMYRSDLHVSIWLACIDLTCMLDTEACSW
jgi:hypothetical protein